ncbi:MAG: hypothetical protein ACFCAD_18100 [Pleurocapsa sp.]
MEQPDFESMTNGELIDYHLEQGQKSEALFEYVRRLNKASQTIWVEPENSMEELDNLMLSLQTKNQSKS